MAVGLLCDVVVVTRYKACNEKKMHLYAVLRVRYFGADR